jgi:hypothetical protein
VGHEGGIFEFLDGLIAWVAPNAKLAGKFALKPTPDAESGGVNFIVMRYATYLAIFDVDVGKLGIVTHRPPCTEAEHRPRAGVLQHWLW